ncbi:O-fucosyltransferase 36-like [Pyrus x bretschneideri]|uniref:O-fucosyltransferase 36-like n=1 Tax=Pyrus x bretschneideri TaxID=225117 RepID=UPI00202ED1A4|nr:O-fucosyltransferase 36-like [Pyrus x bretschneideri]
MERTSSSSSDDDDDRQNLIEQNDRKLHTPRSDAVAAAFRIADDDIDNNSNNGHYFHHQLRRHFTSLKLGDLFNKRSFVLLAIFVPTFVVILFFVTDMKSLLFTTGNFSSSPYDSASGKLLESELRALYLLKQQQVSLFNLWNQTLRNPTNSTSNHSDPAQIPLLDDFKSAVLRQISLNRDIQQVLLSPHRTGNSTEPDFRDFGDFENPSLGDRCRAVDQQFSQRRTIEWKPYSNKYLFAICVSGQMSNHLICLEKHMFFAALLNRVLVIPSPKVDYQFSRVLDIEHINKCLGRTVVVTFEELDEKKKNHVHIDKFICYFSHPNPCYVDDEHVKKLKGAGVSMNKLESAWVEDVKKPTKRTVQDVQSKFSSNDDVIAIGDVFFADLEQEWVMQPRGPLAHKCKTLIEPSRLIMLTAQRFIQTFLGKNFVALHFRRHGFLKFCNNKQPSCFYPIPQAADCIIRVAERANAPVVYLSTDAAESETGLLQSLVVVNGKTVPLVKRPARNSAEKWDALLYRQGIEGDAQVEAMLDKTICAMSSVFIGASGSTFTEDILRLRKDWGSASLCDEYLCQGEDPNFIAENE